MNPVEIATAFLLVVGFVVVSSGLAAAVGAAARLPSRARRFIGLEDSRVGASNAVSWLGVIVFGALTIGAIVVELKDLLTVSESTKFFVAASELAFDAAWILYLVTRRRQRPRL
jgi:hypothetical protein